MNKDDKDICNNPIHDEPCLAECNGCLADCAEFNHKHE